MNNKKTIKKILIGLVIAIVALILYALVAQKQSGVSPQQTGLLSSLGNAQIENIQQTDAQLVNADILKILGSVQHIELRDDIFLNPLFKKLKDTHFAIPKPVRIGRANPFLPIGYTEELLGQQDEQANQGNLFDSFLGGNTNNQETQTDGEQTGTTEQNNFFSTTQ